MKKRFGLRERIIVAVLALLLLAAAVVIYLQINKKTEPLPEENGRYSYDLSEYITFADYTALEVEFADPTVCTEEEIDAAIFQVMLSYAEFSAVEGRKAELYDKVEVDYIGSVDGELDEELVETDYGIVIGYENGSDVDKILSDSLIGKGVGDLVEVEYSYPDDSYNYGAYAGKTVVYSAQVKAVYNHAIPECTDEFVTTLEGYGFTTVADFRASIRQDILDQKKEDKVYAVWSVFYESVEVLKYPEQEKNRYYQDYVTYYTDYAKENNLEFEQFLQEYVGQTNEEFENEAMTYAEYMVKNDMVFTQLSRLMGTTISDEEYTAGIEEYYASEQEEYDSLENFVAQYGEDTLRENLIWDKSLKTLVDMAVRVEPAAD